MAKNNLITVWCFGLEIGRLGLDEHRGTSFFQYSEQFLQQGKYRQLFPLVFKRINQTQAFSKYNNDTFRGLPPMMADSLPDMFGNIIFRTWMESTRHDMKQVSVLEQLAYVGERGMGALEYRPEKKLAPGDTINIAEITEVVRQVLNQKANIQGNHLDHESLLNIFKVGTSAGGARPKILVAENKDTGMIVPGDIITDADHNHYLVKLGIDDTVKYSRELVEYTYYLAATHAGITMMNSKIIDGRHFATQRFDRQEGKKKHVLTATGITGLDFTNPSDSSYENLFDLLIFLKCPHKDVEQLYRRMVFNLVFANHDDHLKNQSLMYDEEQDHWTLAPAYDLTYSLNPEQNIKTRSRALSVNGKRTEIDLHDLNTLAEKYTIKNSKNIIEEVQSAVHFWQQTAKEHGVANKISEGILKNFAVFS